VVLEQAGVYLADLTLRTLPMRAVAALTVAFLLASSPVERRQPLSSPCLAADSTSADLIDDVTELVTGTGPKDSLFRAQLYLPQVAANQVTLVTTDSICYAAIVGLQPTDTTGQAYVLQVGSSAYVVRFPPAYGGNVFFYTLDASFTMKAIAGF